MNYQSYENQANSLQQGAWGADVLEHSLDGIVLVNEYGAIFKWNRAMESITGVCKDDVLGRPIWEVHFELIPKAQKTAQNYAQFKAWLEEYLAPDAPARPNHLFETIYEHSSGEYRVVQDLFFPLLACPLGGLGIIVRDVTRRKHVEDTIARSNLELQAFNTINSAVNCSLKLPDILDSLHKVMAEQLSIPGGAILLYEPESDLLRLHTAWGLPDALQRRLVEVPVNEFYNAAVVRTMRAALTVALNTVPLFAEIGLAPGPDTWEAGLSVPLVAQGNIQGVLELFKGSPPGVLGLFNPGPAGFNPSLISFFEMVGQEVGLAIYNARLYAAESRARRTAETLHAASLALTQTLDLEMVLKTLLQYIERVIPFDSANVALLSDQTHLSVRAARGYEAWLEPDQVLRITLTPDEMQPLYALLQARRSVLVSGSSIPTAMRAYPHLAHVRSWMGIPMIANDQVIGVCGLDKASPEPFTYEHVRLAEALVGQAGVALQNAWLFEQVRAGHERLQGLSRRLVEVQETERRYIARELHDEASQALTSLMVGLRLLERASADPAAVMAGVAELETTVNSVLENLHRLAMDLRPASLDHLGLEAALRQYCEMVSDKHGLMVQFEVLKLARRLPPEMETAIYRVVQEAVTNVVRHARATRVDVLLEQRRRSVIAIIEDNGVGFDPAAAAVSNRLGLFGMRERVEMLNGKLIIESQVGSGTTILIEAPYDDSNTDSR